MGGWKGSGKGELAGGFAGGGKERAVSERRRGPGERVGRLSGEGMITSSSTQALDSARYLD